MAKKQQQSPNLRIRSYNKFYNRIFTGHVNR